MSKNMGEDEKLQRDFDFLNSLHVSTNKAAETLQERNASLEAEVALLCAKLENCQKALDINKEIMRNALTRQNEMQEGYGQEISELRAKIKELEG